MRCSDLEGECWECVDRTVVVDMDPNIWGKYVEKKGLVAGIEAQIYQYIISLDILFDFSGR